MQKSLNSPSLSLSQKMRADVTHNSQSISKPSRSRTLPQLKANTSPTYSGLFEQYSPHRGRNAFTRLSGLPDSVNSSGLLSDISIPKHPSSLCVRCGTTAALCMGCAEQDAEDALTFYRKTRAAGAATLFSKAFVEAGFRKLLKFMVFRLLKNSCQTRIRQRNKKKAIVEKLFGTNLVYIPFAAWRRYTKENIVNRKNKTIEQLTAQIAVLENQVQKLSYTVQEGTREVRLLFSISFFLL
jgi:hypothetical protein